MTTEDKDLRIQMKFKNNILYKLIQERMGQYGFDNIRELCTLLKINYQILLSYLNLRIFPYSKNGKLKPNTLDIVSKLTAPDKPETYFPKGIYGNSNSERREYQKVEFEISSSDYLSLDSPEVLLLEAPSEVVEEANKYFDAENLKKILQYLSPRERKIISMRYGLEDNSPSTIDEVGKEFGVSRERVRQIEAKILQKLRDHPLTGELFKEKFHSCKSCESRISLDSTYCWKHAYAPYY